MITASDTSRKWKLINQLIKLTYRSPRILYRGESLFPHTGSGKKKEEGFKNNTVGRSEYLKSQPTNEISNCRPSVRRRCWPPPSSLTLVLLSSPLLFSRSVLLSHLSASFFPDSSFLPSFLPRQFHVWLQLAVGRHHSPCCKFGRRIIPFSMPWFVVRIVFFFFGFLSFFVIVFPLFLWLERKVMSRKREHWEEGHE